MQANLTTRKTVELQTLSRKNTKSYLDLYKNGKASERSKDMRATLFNPISKNATWTELLKKDEEEKLARLENRISTRKGTESIIGVSKQSLKEKSDHADYWQASRFTLDGVVEEVRRSYRAELDEQDFFRSRREYIDKNIALERRKSIAPQDSLRISDLKKQSIKSNYKLPSRYLLSNTNFNDFYSIPKTISKPVKHSITSLQELADIETPEPTLVMRASILTVKDTVELGVQLNQSEKAVSAMMLKFSDTPDVRNREKRRLFKKLSINLENKKEKEVVQRKAKEDDIKYKVFIDWDESPSPSRSHYSNSSNLSLDNKRLVKKRNKSKGEFTQAMLGYKQILKNNQPAELRGLKKRARKRFIKNNPLKRENSLALQNFSFKPRLITTNSYRTFGTSLIT